MYVQFLTIHDDVTRNLFCFVYFYNSEEPFDWGNNNRGEIRTIKRKKTSDETDFMDTVKRKLVTILPYGERLVRKPKYTESLCSGFTTDVQRIDYQKGREMYRPLGDF